jgi:hypothetical protein
VKGDFIMLCKKCKVPVADDSDLEPMCHIKKSMVKDFVLWSAVIILGITVCASLIISYKRDNQFYKKAYFRLTQRVGELLERDN